MTGRHRLFLVSVLVLCSLLVSPVMGRTGGEKGAETELAPLKVYQQLKSLEFDRQRIADVRYVTLAKNQGKLRFDRGVFYFSKPIAGKVTGAVFLGEGRLQLTPPDEIERYQVRRFVDRDSLDERFTAAYVRFTDGTDEALARRLAFREGDVPDRVRELHQKISRFFLEQRGVNVASEILSDLLNNSQSGTFFAVLEHQQPKLNFPSYYVFSFDRRARESVGVYQFFPHRTYKPFYTLCSFPDTSRAPRDASQKPDSVEVLKVQSYRMNIVVRKNGEIKGDARVTLTPAVRYFRYLSFGLYNKLHVDSVQTVAGDTLTFIQEKDQGSFGVVLPDSLPAQALRICYSGKALRQRGGQYFLRNNLYWYPRIGYLIPATYDVTYRFPRSLKLVATGMLVEQKREDRAFVSRWVEETPSMGAAFTVGDFDTSSFRRDDRPLSVYSRPDRPKSMRRHIGGDVQNSLYIFEQLLGGLPYHQVRVAEIAGNVSFGFPGLLFLSSITFQQELEGVMEALRGHEASHQWWGNVVGWKSYRDQWLSEGLAEYSGALIAEFLLDGDRTFFQILRGWRNDLLEKGHIGVSVGLQRFGFSKSDLAASDGLRAGPIYLGRRLGEKHAVDYYLITYEKGAYVIHMLRTLLRDFTTGSDERFWQMLADFVHTYRGKKASTEDFKRIVEKHAGQNMDWFFDQWVYGIQVPTYLYSTQLAEENGKYWVDLTVRQEDVPPTFRMPVPVGIELHDGEHRTRLVDMRGEQKSFRLGPFTSRPQRIFFNDFAGVLARVKKE